MFPHHDVDTLNASAASQVPVVPQVSGVPQAPNHAVAERRLPSNTAGKAPVAAAHPTIPTPQAEVPKNFDVLNPQLDMSHLLGGYGQAATRPVTSGEQFRPSPRGDGSLIVDPEIHLPSPGMDVDISYFYNSNSSFDSPFGYGRTISLNLWARSTEVPGSVPNTTVLMVEIMRGNGTIVSYLEDSNGVFQPQTSQLVNKLEQVGGKWRETTPDGRVTLYPLGEPGQPCPVESVTDAVGNKHTWYYDFGLITALEDGEERLVTLTYDQSTYMLSSIEDWAGRITTFTYDTTTATGKTFLSSVMGPTGCVTEYDYNSSARLTGITDPNGQTTTYTYDTQGRVSGRTVAGVGSWTYTYPTGQMVVSGPGGVVVTHTVDPSGEITDASDASGRATSYTYNSRGLETSRQYPDGGIFTTVYDSNDIFPIATVDPLGHITTTLRDQYGNPTTMLYADGSVEGMVWGYPTSSFDTSGSKRRMQAHVQYPNGLAGTQLRTTYTYTPRGLVSSVQDPEGFTTSYSYDTFGNLTSIQDAENYRTTFTYDAAGNVKTARNPLGQVTQFTYDNQNRVTSVKDPLLHVWTFTYDGVGNLTSQIDPLGHETLTSYNAYDKPEGTRTPLGFYNTVTYDAQGRPYQFRDALGHVTSLEYDQAGRVVAAVDPLLNRTTTLYDAVGRPNRLIDAEGKTTTTLYDQAWRPYAVVDPLGKVTTVTYDNANRPQTVKDARGYVSTTMYDGAGRPTTFVDALGQTTVTAYDKRGLPTKITDPLMQIRTMSYDSLGRLRSVATPLVGFPLGDITTYSYDPAGRLESIRNPRNYVWTNVYDAAGRLTGKIDPLNHRSTLLYDNANRLIGTQDALGRITTAVYDDDDRLTNIVSPLGFTTTYQYDAAGRLTTFTDANGHTALTFYDDADRVLATQDAGTIRRTTFTYDKVGRVTEVRNSNNKVSRMRYNARGEMERFTDPLNRLTTYLYDAVGNVTTFIDGRSLVTTISYDALNRMTTLVYGSGGVTTMAFDAAGRQTGMTDVTGVTTYAYDAADRLILVSYPNTGTLTYAYNRADSRVGMTDRDGGLTTYTYDAANRLTSLKNPANETTNFSYDNLDRETGRTFGTGLTMSREFDKDGRITTLSYQTPSLTALSTMTYDKVGNVLTTREWDGSMTTYTYDDSDQLLSEARSGANGYSRTYTYSPIGNRLTMNAGGVLTTYTYDDANQIETRLTGGTLTTFTYDGAGNRILEQAGTARTTYLWNQDNRLTGLRLPDSTVLTYLYAGDGDLRQRLASNANHFYLRDGENQLQEVNGVDGTTLRSYTDYPGEWGGLTSVKEEVSGGASRFFAFDRMGSVRLMLDSAGTVMDEMLYTAFGEQLRATGADIKRFGYEGAFGYLRLNADLMWVRERVYDAKTGVWLSQDPIGFDAGDWNLYRYVNNSPNYLVDPSGLSANDYYFKTRGETFRAAKLRLGIPNNLQPVQSYVIGNPKHIKVDNKRYFGSKNEGSWGRYWVYRLPNNELRVIAEHTGDGPVHMHAYTAKGDDKTRLVCPKTEKYATFGEEKHHYYYGRNPPEGQDQTFDRPSAMAAKTRADAEAAAGNMETQAQNRARIAQEVTARARQRGAMRAAGVADKAVKGVGRVAGPASVAFSILDFIRDPYRWDPNTYVIYEINGKYYNKLGVELPMN